MNTSAISHRCSYTDCYAYNSDYLEINLKTGHDITQVFVIWQDTGANRIAAKGIWNGAKVPMTKKFSLSQNDIWNCQIEPPFKRTDYYFEIHCGDEKILLFENDFATEEEYKNTPGSYGKFKMAWMNPSDIVKVPSWVKDTIWYQIFPERFCSEGKHFKRLKNKDWYDDGNMEWDDFYGGDLAGIISKLEYLKDLGISGIYLTPIFESTSNHKYNTTDYTKIDPDFGTEEEMIELIEKAHSLGIRIMLDAVFNHSGLDFAPWQDVLVNQKNSRYKDWFFINKFPVTKDMASTEDGRYFSFDFVHGMPKLNTNNPEVQEYFTEICRKWVRDWKIDGIRFDVANEISHSFVKKLHRELLAENPELYLLGEIWTDSLSWLNGDEYHSVMNYPFQNAVERFFKNGTPLKESLDRVYSMYYRQTNDALFNLLDTHDTGRLIDTCNSIEEFYQQLTILMTMQGTPCIYYGTEIALGGSDGPYNRRPMPWKKLEEKESQDVFKTVQAILNVRNQNKAARSETVKFVSHENQKLLEYIKVDTEAGEKLRVIINASDKEEKIQLWGQTVFQIKADGDTIKSGGILIQVEKVLTVNDKEYKIQKLLGKGKGGYSYLAERDGKFFVLKQIHHEPCAYYKFGDKIQSEKNDYQRLRQVEIALPELYEIDEKNERILKEYIDGPTVVELVKSGGLKPVHLEQIKEMCSKLYPAGLNIDYYPTNFVVQDDRLYYIDYECNNYMDEWNFENWGIKYWSKTEEFVKAFGE
ncbi:MAG: alpha amylase N-terminal ig-like domain-containing protein [Treponema sp.]|nr:alpha amylase N-terminal ig-like domain-containing protein [Treponema sp.]